MIRAKFAVNSMKHMWTYDQEKESIVSLLRTTTMKLLHPNLLQNYSSKSERATLTQRHVSGRQVPFNSEFVYVMPLNRFVRARAQERQFEPRHDQQQYGGADMSINNCIRLHEENLGLRQEVVVLHSGGQLRHHLLDDVPTQREKSGRASSGVFDRPKAVGNCDLMARAAFEGKGRREKA
ncbi:hypothetical protein KXD40_000144 [Peronospora effusa]|uniref:Uncharacterized protein n=1 Tax=Peronospora effusa TaxID=542832 RepID=A0A3M6VHU2_9STRA|nr:hypothetical protein DD238_001231 [Peronospora effusa]RQM17202.1 hypothetical protein DD237_001855 [Peronospora effusa]UIZ20686.1 hypothetical protein KXD40_000144 [Peronospora effusa]